jgi:hypothetical protein
MVPQAVFYGGVVLQGGGMDPAVSLDPVLEAYVLYPAVGDVQGGPEVAGRGRVFPRNP